MQLLLSRACPRAIYLQVCIGCYFFSYFLGADNFFFSFGKKVLIYNFVPLKHNPWDYMLWTLPLYISFVFVTVYGKLVII